MSTRVDTVSLIPGACVVGVRGLGIPAATIRATTATGDHGPGLLYNEWDGPEDDAKELMALVESVSPVGTLFVNEDGSFIWSDLPVGAYTANYQVFADGQPIGSSTATVTVTPPGFSVQPSGASAQLAYGSPTVQRVAVFTVQPAGQASQLAYGLPVVASQSQFTVQAQGVDRQLAYGLPVVASQSQFTVQAQGVDRQLAYGLPVVVPQAAFSINPSGQASLLAYGQPQVERHGPFTVQASGLPSTLVYGLPFVVPSGLILTVSHSFGAARENSSFSSRADSARLKA